MRSVRAGTARTSIIVLSVLFAATASTAHSATYNLHGAPFASFMWSPQLPNVGESVTLTSTSTDLSSRITRYAWDFADNGPFGAFEDGGPTAGATFATPAPHVVRLRVTAADGLSSIAAETIKMSQPPASAHVMYPFPIVRIRGTDFAFGVRVTQLAIKAPARAEIHVTCRARRCPARAVTKVSTNGRRREWIRFRRFERFLPAGVSLEIRVSRSGEIGSYTRFHVRRRKLPVRADSCLDAAAIKPIACPSGRPG
jgi:PKD repeat protein